MYDYLYYGLFIITILLILGFRIKRKQSIQEFQEDAVCKMVKVYMEILEKSKNKNLPKIEARKINDKFIIRKTETT